MVNSGYSNFFIDKYILKFRTKFLKNKTIAFHIPKKAFFWLLFFLLLLFFVLFFFVGEDERLAFLKIDLFLTQIIF